jgi:hypothetical protein
VATVVYRYGTPARAAKDTPAPVIEQLLLGHELRNTLVEIHQRYEEAVASAWATHSEVTRVDDDLERTATALDEMRERIKAARRTHRSTKLRPENKTELAAVRTALSEAKTRRKEVRAAAYPAIKEAIVDAKGAEQAAVKATYTDFVQGRGLYWATFNDIVDRHRSAVKRVTADRKQGRPAQLRFSRWNGTGTITVQLQRKAADPQRTPRILASGQGKWRNVVRIEPWIDPTEFSLLSRGEQRRAGRGQVVMRAGSGHVTIPIQMHRMLPADADITIVRLTRSRIGAAYRLALSVTAKLPDSPRKGGIAAAALHLGWRSRKDGSIRVGTIAAIEPLHVPDDLADVIETRGDGTWAEIVLPVSFRGSITQIESLRSIRDKNLDATRAKLHAWLTEHGPVALTQHPITGEAQSVSAADVAHWRSPARFATLTQHWRDNPPTGGVHAAAELEAWRKQDKHLWNWEAHSRAQHIARRDDAWKRVAAWISSRFSHLILDEFNLTRIARVPDVDADHTAQARAARALRTIAAPGLLRTAISNAAQRRGTTVTTIPTTVKGTVVHFTCGGENTRDQRYIKNAVVTCDHCGNTYDQDHNAAAAALAASGLIPIAIQGSARAAQP